MIPKTADNIKPTAKAMIKALGGNEITGMCRCPAHDDKTPSLHVEAWPNAPAHTVPVKVRCHAGCEQADVIDVLRARGLWPSKTRDTSSNTHRGGHKEQYREQRRKLAQERIKISADDEQEPEASDDEKDKLRQFRSILRTAAGAGFKPREYFKVMRPVKYLNGRGIDTVPEAAMLLPAPETKRLTGIRFPMMVFPIIGPTRLRPAGLQGAHCTFLTPNGTKNLRGKDRRSVRRIFGTAKSGYIPLGKSDPDRALIMAEGVENALSASWLAGGLPAIAAGSAGNMKDIMLPPCSEVIVAGDNDRVGRKAAEAAAAVIASTGRVVRIAIPEHHKDWNDALRDRGADRDELRRAILNAEPFDGPIASVTSLGMQEFGALEFPPRRYLLRPWLTTTGLTMIDALPGHGKTWLALSIAYAVGSEQPLLEWSVEQPGKVLYVDGELPGELLQHRLKQLGPQLPNSNFRLLSHSQFEARGAMMLDIGTQEGRDFLDAEIERHQIDLVILDSVTTLVHSGEDNDVESWRAIQARSLKHRARGRAVIYLHHHGRSGNPRGTSSREIVLDARIKLTRDADLTTDGETAFKLEFPKAREFYGADTAPMIAYLSTKSGTVEWRRETVKDNTRDRVAAMLRDGLKPADIAKELKITRGRVSQIMKQNNLTATTKEDPQRNSV